MPTINHNERKINYLVQGKGDPIVLLHGFCADHSIWDDLIPIFKKNKIIRIDLPGFGQSQTLASSSVENFAEVVKAVLDTLGIKKCTLIGHSMGGYVSLAFTQKYESMLNGLGIFHSHPLADSEEKKNNRTKSIEFIKKNGHYHYVKQLIPNLFPLSFSSSNNFLINKLIHRASTFSAEGIIGGLELMKTRPDQTAVLKKITCPVLFIVGKEDEIVPQKGSIEQTAMPSVSHIHLLEGIGHMGMFEAKKEIQKIIKNFVLFCKNFEQKIN